MNLIHKHLQDIDQQVEDLKLFKTLSRLSNIQKNRKKAMQKILEEEEKNDDEDEFYGCQKWFKSKECSQLEIEAFEIWSTVLASTTRLESHAEIHGII